MALRSDYRRGDPLPARDVNDRNRALVRLGALRSSAGAVARVGAGGRQLARVQPETIYARLTGGASADGGYPWREVYPAPLGTWVLSDRAGAADVDPAFELQHRTDLAAGDTVFELTRDRGRWLFDADCGECGAFDPCANRLFPLPPAVTTLYGTDTLYTYDETGEASPSVISFTLSYHPEHYFRVPREFPPDPDEYDEWPAAGYWRSAAFSNPFWSFDGTDTDLTMVVTILPLTTAAGSSVGAVIVEWWPTPGQADDVYDVPITAENTGTIGAYLCASAFASFFFCFNTPGPGLDLSLDTLAAGLRSFRFTEVADPDPPATSVELCVTVRAPGCTSPGEDPVVGAPIAGADVVITGPGLTSSSGTTDAEGRYCVTVTLAGAATIVATRGWCEGRATAVISGCGSLGYLDRVEATVELCCGTARVVVRDARTGLPIEGATVSAPGHADVTTGADALASFTVASAEAGRLPKAADGCTPLLRVTARGPTADELGELYVPRCVDVPVPCDGTATDPPTELWLSPLDEDGDGEPDWIYAGDLCSDAGCLEPAPEGRGFVPRRLSGVLEAEIQVGGTWISILGPNVTGSPVALEVDAHALVGSAAGGSPFAAPPYGLPPAAIEYRASGPSAWSPPPALTGSEDECPTAWGTWDLTIRAGKGALFRHFTPGYTPSSVDPELSTTIPPGRPLCADPAGSGVAAIEMLAPALDLCRSAGGIVADYSGTGSAGPFQFRYRVALAL